MPRVRRTGAFRLDMTADAAFPLFTAEGERAWVPGWAPVYPDGAVHEVGQVFLTGSDAEATIWTVVRADPAARRSTFARITPGRRAGTVDVRVEPDGDGCRVHVAYDMTALTEDAEAALGGYGEAAFEAMLHEWKRLIEARAGLDQVRAAGVE